MEDGDGTPRVNLVSVRSYADACHYYLVLNVIHEICSTSLQQRTSRFRETERDSHEMLFSCFFSSLCSPSEIITFSSDQTTSTEAANSTCACVGQE